MIKRKSNHSLMRACLLYMLCLLYMQGNGQGVLDKKISLTLNQVSLQFACEQLAKTSGVPISYGGQVSDYKPTVTIKANNLSLKKSLEQLLSGHPFNYEVVNGKILIRYDRGKVNPKMEVLKPAVKPEIHNKQIKGTITDEEGKPIPNATVILQGSNRATATDEQGRFEFNNLTFSENAQLEISCVGYITKTEVVAVGDDILISLLSAAGTLDETVVIAYGSTSRRLNTGSVGKVTAAEIQRQPVSNPLAALQGRVPGLIVSPSNGITGSSFKVQIRGQNALGIGAGVDAVNSDPLFIIDGVPFAPNNVPINSLSISLLSGRGNSGLSPFNLLNPGDIESIEVLKDADATAIYGSRGGNGVILITTRKGRSNKTTFNVNYYTGVSAVTKTVPLMNTEQYLEMRREAFANDNIAPTTNNAPDLTLFEQNRYTDFTRLLTRGTATTHDIQTSLAGGSANTHFLISGAFHRETSVFAGNMSDTKAGARFNLNHRSSNQRLLASLSGGYTSDMNNLITLNIGTSKLLPPNYPDFYDENDELVWSYKGYSIINPMANLLKEYEAKTSNFLSDFLIQYAILPGLIIRATSGFNEMSVKEVLINPIASENPAFDPLGFAQFGNNSFKSWSIEPQVQYTKKWAKGKFDVLVGTTFQETINDKTSISAFNYTNDALLRNLSAATSFMPTTDYYQYRYNAVFTRINYNWDARYILNLTGRRDGSSRFGPGKQFANFGALGGAWLLSNEKFIKPLFPVLSFGKIRGSYGITGTDQIGDYQYLDSWRNTANVYQNTVGLFPARLFNENYKWETNRKLEIALEAGFFRDRLLISTSYFRNQSDDRLVSYTLPTQTGFTSVIRNFPAVIRNTGLEAIVEAKIIAKKNISWQTIVNLTVPKNELVSFPGIESSSYSGTYTVGKSLSAVNGLRFLGVDPTTGIFTFQDVNNDGAINSRDYQYIGDLDPDYFGGVTNRFRYKNLDLDIFFEFNRQLGSSLMRAAYNVIPGTINNMPEVLLSSRWQNPGDHSNYQKFTTTTNTDAYRAAETFRGLFNSGWYSNASYIRCKNIALSYHLPNNWTNRIHLTHARIYLNGQNLFIITPYDGGDPETQNFRTVLPPLKTLVAGIQIDL